MDGHYIEIRGRDRSADVPAAVIRLLKPARVEGGWRSFPLLTLPSGTEIFVDELDSEMTVLAIADKGNATARHTGARQVYDVLVEQAEWELRWTSDDAPGVIAIRPAVAAAASAPTLRLVPAAG